MTNPTEEVKLPEMEVEVLAWLDDGLSASSGTEESSFRVVTDKTKRNMPRAAVVAYIDPLVRLSDAQAEIAALRADAERYRWLRSGVRSRQGVAVSGQRYIDRSIHQAKMRFDFWCSPDELDAAIDAARQKTREQP